MLCQAGKIGLRSVLFLLIMGFLAVGQGVLWILVFRSHFSGLYVGTEEPKEHETIIREATNATLTRYAAFRLYLFLKLPCSPDVANQSAEELIESILFSIVPDNLIEAALTPNILSVLSFSVVFGGYPAFTSWFVVPLTPCRVNSGADSLGPERKKSRTSVFQSNQHHAAWTRRKNYQIDPDSGFLLNQYVIALKFRYWLL